MKGHIRPRGDKTWAIVIDIGQDASGRRRQKWHTVHGPKKEAERELARLLHELNTGGYVEPSRLTVREYLEAWLNDYAKLNVARKTCERYAQIVNWHIIPALGSTPLHKLTPPQIQGFYRNALESGRKDGTGGLSPQTVVHCHRVLRGALAQAVRGRMLLVNPCDAVDPPRVQRRELVTLNQQQVGEFLQACADTHLYIPVMLAVTTGMRRGEILGLRWEDIDLEAGTLCVRRSLEETKAGLFLKEPKTAGSRRVIKLLPMAVQALREHKAAQAEQMLLLGEKVQAERFVCCWPDGRPIPPNHVTQKFTQIPKRAGLPRIRFHDLRHTHATLMLELGVHPKIVCERLGHSTIRLTLDTYSHVLPSMQDEAASRLDQALKAASLSPS